MLGLLFEVRPTGHMMCYLDVRTAIAPIVFDTTAAQSEVLSMILSETKLPKKLHCWVLRRPLADFTVKIC